MRAGRISHNHAPNVGMSGTIESLSRSWSEQPISTAIGLASIQPPHVSLIDIKVKFENNKALTLISYVLLNGILLLRKQNNNKKLPLLF